MYLLFKHTSNSFACTAHTRDLLSGGIQSRGGPLEPSHSALYNKTTDKLFTIVNFSSF